MIVLNSSAMLAFLKGEEGGDLVRDILFDEERDVPVYAHAINLAEVFYGFLRGGVSVAEAVMSAIDECH